MDSRRFGEISRRLAGATTRRGALATLVATGLGLGAGVGLPGRDAEAKRKRCRPACGSGQTCVKGSCVCTEGTACGATCCRIGQACQGGQCVELPEPGQCAAFGAACKRTGIPCCDGTVCASGQGGQDDIACYVPAGGACATTAECVYDSTCKGGACVANPQPQPAPACTVCASGCPFSTIEAAIEAAADGATVTVAPGAYTPVLSGGVYLFVQRALTLKSCGQGTVTVSCPAVSDQDTCVGVAGSLVLEGFALKGSSSSGGTQGILAIGTVVVSNVSIDNFGIGVYAGVSPTATIGGGVSLSNLSYGLTASDNAAITCSTAPNYLSNVANRCDSRTFSGCGCAGA